jgi:ElaB/YqjD/DUF883 family membrane-anchored ribosome-binding protein
MSIHQENAMNDTPSSSTQFNTLAQNAMAKADEAIVHGRKVADGALDTLQDKASDLVGVAPSTLSRVAAQVDEMTRRGVEMARAARESAREQAAQASDRTVSYIQEEPVKAVLIAAAAGAGIAALVAMLSRGKRANQR